MAQQGSRGPSWAQELLGFSTRRGRTAWAAAALAAAILWVRPKGWAARRDSVNTVAAGGGDYGTGPHTPAPASGGTVDYGQLHEEVGQSSASQKQR